MATAGFTLLEVMIAVAIIAIALVTLIGAQSQSVDIAAIARFDTDAALLAQQKLAELTLASGEGVSSEEGDFGDAFPAYAWKTEVSALGSEEIGFKGAEDLLTAVDLTIYLKEREQSSFSLRQIFYLPPETSR